jgi:hypothetical protein
LDLPGLDHRLFLRGRKRCRSDWFGTNVVGAGVAGPAVAQLRAGFLNEGIRASPNPAICLQIGPSPVGRAPKNIEGKSRDIEKTHLPCYVLVVEHLNVPTK